MISNSMLHYIDALPKCTSEDSFALTVIDWITLGCYTGFQKSEWCSDHHDSFVTIDDPNWGDCLTALPGIARDYGFAAESSRRIHDPATSSDHDVVFTSLCFRKQKNNDNGQTLTYRRHHDSHWLCPTQASLNIVRQAQHLETPCDHPVVVYHDQGTGLCRQITAFQVAAFLRQVAHKVFNIPTSHKDLLAWSCHSICVTATNLLRRARFSDSYISINGY
jgi:hypothetical protein